MANMHGLQELRKTKNLTQLQVHTTSVIPAPQPSAFDCCSDSRRVASSDLHISLLSLLPRLLRTRCRGAALGPVQE